MKIHFQLLAAAQVASLLFYGEAFVVPNRARAFRAVQSQKLHGSKGESSSKPNPPDAPPPESLLEPNLPFFFEEVDEDVQEAVKVESEKDEIQMESTGSVKMEESKQEKKEPSDAITVTSTDPVKSEIKDRDENDTLDAYSDFEQQAAARLRIASWWLEDLLVSSLEVCVPGSIALFRFMVY
jgi:hypothetical protein